MKILARMANFSINFRSYVVGGLLLSSLLANSASAQEQEYANPIRDGFVHNGVISCYGTTCHSKQVASNLSVRQNEIITWDDDTSPSGSHSRAYAVLKNSKSRIISNNLGIGPAWQAPKCLACHSDFVPVDNRGEDFQLSEGVSCEACHGGSKGGPSGGWLTTHYAPDQKHSDNLANGMYPTDNPKARANLCLNCHLGSDAPNQFITHQIMGAGHPRISFELDLFTELQRHHDEDADYIERGKTKSSGVKIWSIGQAISLERQMSLFSDPKLGRVGAFPELVFFDCHACHRTFSDAPDARPSWRSNPARALGPGVPVFNDANMIMLAAVVKTIAPEMEDELRSAGRRFHRSVSLNGRSISTATENLKAIASRLATRLEREEFSRSEVISIMKTILADSLSRNYTDYAGGEQAVIATSSFIRTLGADGYITASQEEGISRSLERAFQAVDDPNRYNQATLRAALQSVSRKVNQL